MSSNDQQAEVLRREARVLCRYLLDTDPGPGIAERYVDACGVLFAGDAPESGHNEAHDPERPGSKERAVLRFCRERPGALPFLDAAAGILAPRSMLRRRVLLMTAVLETDTTHVDEFEPTIASPLRFFLSGAGLVCLAAGKALIGLLLWPFVRGRAE